MFSFSFRHLPIPPHVTAFNRTACPRAVRQRSGKYGTPRYKGTSAQVHDFEGWVMACRDLHVPALRSGASMSERPDLSPFGRTCPAFILRRQVGRGHGGAKHGAFGCPVRCTGIVEGHVLRQTREAGPSSGAATLFAEGEHHRPGTAEYRALPHSQRGWRTGERRLRTVVHDHDFKRILRVGLFLQGGERLCEDPKRRPIAGHDHAYARGGRRRRGWRRLTCPQSLYRTESDFRLVNTWKGKAA